jgi:hypothetical protein
MIVKNRPILSALDVPSRFTGDAGYRAGPV